jgi:hypothetical protein
VVVASNGVRVDPTGPVRNSAPRFDVSRIGPAGSGLSIAVPEIQSGYQVWAAGGRLRVCVGVRARVGRASTSMRDGWVGGWVATHEVLQVMGGQQRVGVLQVCSNTNTNTNTGCTTFAESGCLTRSIAGLYAFFVILLPACIALRVFSCQPALLHILACHANFAPLDATAHRAGQPFVSLLRAVWDYSDGESGIHHVTWSVRVHHDAAGHQPVDPVYVSSASEGVRGNLTLSDNDKYFLSLLVCNGAGLCTLETNVSHPVAACGTVRALALLQLRPCACGKAYLKGHARVPCWRSQFGFGFGLGFILVLSFPFTH